VPLGFNKEGLDDKIMEILHMESDPPDLGNWEKLCANFRAPKPSVSIAVVGKYTNFTESYKSLNEALVHGGFENDCHVELIFVDSEKITLSNCQDMLKDANGILVPGGFGTRGIEGKICAARYARENKVPYFGICLGMHIAVIELSRNVLGLEHAHSSEFDQETEHPVIYLMKEWHDPKKGVVEKRNRESDKGGTMRLGAYPCKLYENTLAHDAYRVEHISERHRHRYEFNNEFKEMLRGKGVVFSGESPKGDLVEIIELENHPWFLACQFHPEFKSRPMKPHPLFTKFINAALLNLG